MLLSILLLFLPKEFLKSFFFFSYCFFTLSHSSVNLSSELCLYNLFQGWPDFFSRGPISKIIFYNSGLITFLQEVPLRSRKFYKCFVSYLVIFGVDREKISPVFDRNKDDNLAVIDTKINWNAACGPWTAVWPCLIPLYCISYSNNFCRSCN